MLNVHAGGGLAMMRAAGEAAARAAAEFKVPRPLCLGVTVLTSLDGRALATELGVHANVPAHVLRLADHARSAGLDGCVASPHEIALLRRALGAGWVIVTPGIRPDAADDDQARVATPAAALRAGADYLVIGRPITGAPEPAAAVAAIVASLKGDGTP
jgi:orotidine-5'-phosphate decarboxylase